MSVEVTGECLEGLNLKIFQCAQYTWHIPHCKTFIMPLVLLPMSPGWVQSSWFCFILIISLSLAKNPSQSHDFYDKLFVYEFDLLLAVSFDRCICYALSWIQLVWLILKSFYSIKCSNWSVCVIWKSEYSKNHTSSSFPKCFQT